MKVILFKAQNKDSKNMAPYLRNVTVVKLLLCLYAVRVTITPYSLNIGWPL